MPNEHKKRGRRGEQQKRKLDHADEELERAKRLRLEGTEPPQLDPAQSYQEHADEDGHQLQHGEFGDTTTTATTGETPFFGLLDDEELEYFKRADEILELDQFGSDEERHLFLANVYREADGKELKMAHSKVCSRLVERLILRSSSAQLKKLFQKFSGQ